VTRRLGSLALLLATTSVAPALPASSAPGEASVTVQNLAGGVDTTSDISVRLVLTWPAGADQVAVGNGDGTSQAYAVADVLDWQLTPVSTGQPAETKTVTVTYTGPGISVTTSSDSILLDTQRPQVPEQRLYQNGEGWFLAVRAEDAGTGIRSFALLGRTGQSITGRVVCSTPVCESPATEAIFLAKARPRLTRVVDGAGNAKVVQLVRRATRCSVADERYPVFTLGPRFHDCYSPGDRCRQEDGHFWNRSAYVRCRKVDGRFRVVER
jgi:hypothetical protein